MIRTGRKKNKNVRKLILSPNTLHLNILQYKILIYKLEKHSRYVCRSLSELARNIGVKEKVVFYSARKSFAQYAFDLGIPDSIIDYCLAHSDNGRGIVRYYTKTRFKQAEIAISRVVDYINNPEKYKEYIEMKADIMLMKV